MVSNWNGKGIEDTVGLFWGFQMKMNQVDIFLLYTNHFPIVCLYLSEASQLK